MTKSRIAMVLALGIVVGTVGGPAAVQAVERAVHEAPWLERPGHGLR